MINPTEISIKKEKLTFVLFLKKDNQFIEISINDLISYIKKQSSSLVQFETVEQNQILLSGYFVFKNTSTFRKQLQKAAKAQVSF